MNAKRFLQICAIIGVLRLIVLVPHLLYLDEPKVNIECKWALYSYFGDIVFQMLIHSIHMRCTNQMKKWIYTIGLIVFGFGAIGYFIHSITLNTSREDMPSLACKQFLMIDSFMLLCYWLGLGIFALPFFHYLQQPELQSLRDLHVDV
jgi:hypothetical protein